MERSRRDLLLGLVFFSGLALLLWATFTLSNISFERKGELTLRFPQASGLRDGDPVLVLGNRFGQVVEVAYDPVAPRPNDGGVSDNPIRVRLRLDRPLGLRSNARIQIKDSSLLGGKMIEIDPGTSAEPFPGDRVFVGQVQVSAIDALGDMVGGQDNKDNFSGILRGLREFVDKINSEKGTIGALARERELHDEVVAAVRLIRSIAQKVDTGEGPIGRLVNDRGLADGLANAVEGIRSIVAKIDEGRGLAGRLVNDEAMAEDLASTLDNVQEVTRGVREGEGTLGVLARDADTAANTRTLVADLASVARKANDPGAGPLGALLGDGDLRRSVQRLLDNVAETTEEIRRGNGLLGRIIYDRDLGERFSRVINIVARAVEDAREAAPIGTFFTVFGGVF